MTTAENAQSPRGAAMRETATIVVGLGPVTSSVVQPILGDKIRFVVDPTAAELSEAEGAIVRAAYVVDRTTLTSMPRLRVIARTGVGVELVDVVAAAERNIPVVVTPGSNTNAVAEGAFAHVLHLVKRLGPLTSLVRSDRWDERTGYPIGDLEGSTIGIIGYGRIGRRVAELASAFGMIVIAYDPITTPPLEIAVSSLSQLAARSNVISLHVPLTPDTYHMIDTSMLSRLRPGTVLVNCGRGALVDLDAALDALLSGQLSGIGLDVFDTEPPHPHPIFDHPDVVLTPHVMGLSVRATETTFIDAARGIVDVLAGRIPAATAPVPDRQKELPT